MEPYDERSSVYSKEGEMSRLTPDEILTFGEKECQTAACRQIVLMRYPLAKE